VAFEEWPPNKPKCFSNITLVYHKDKVKSKNEIYAIATVKTKGAFSTLHRESSRPRDFSLKRLQNIKHQSLELAEEYLKQNVFFKDVTRIFKLVNPSENKSCMILIDGAPGIGKTYLCKEIAYQWSKRQLLTERKLLFLVFLHEQRMHSLKSIKDLTRYCCQMENEKTIGLIANYLQDTEGESLTLLLDGYNEISENLPHDHLISRIINRSILSKSIVVVTSRSIACGSLYDLAEHRMEIIGFTKKDRNEYITKALKDLPLRIKELRQYFDDHPTVCSLCYIPLNMTIFLYLFKQNDLPQSCTELYRKIVELTVRYYIKKNQQSYEKLQTTMILSLAQFSYDTLRKDQVVFSLAEVSKACPDINFRIPGAMYGFGLLQATEHFGTEGPEKMYSLNFAHYSIQEYLAAFYIQSLPDDKQFDLLKDTFWNEKYLNTWIMYVGLTKGRTIAFKSFLADKQSALAYRYSEPIQISSKIMNDKLKCLYLFQCFLEAKNKEVCSRIGESLQNRQIDLSGETLLPNHVVTLAFFLTRSFQYTAGWDRLDLSNCNMQDTSCFTLLRELNSCEAKIQIRTIDLSCNQLTASSAGMLAELVLKCGTEELDVTGNQLKDEGAELFSFRLQGNKNLKLVIMDDNDITSNVADKIETEMSSTTSLQIIGITSQQLYVRNECGSHITEVLQHYSTLTKFSMSNCLITGEEMIKILKLLAKNLYLNTLHFLHNDLGRMEVNAFTSELSMLKCLSNFTLVEPEILNIAADELINALNFSDNSKVISLSNPKLQAIRASYVEISHILHSNSSIIFLEIPECYPENEQSVDLLAAAIRASPSLQKLDVSNNNLNVVAIRKLANAIRGAVNLKSLMMKSNGIDENAAKALAHSLRDKCGLEVLDLGVNRISTTGATEISQALKNNTVLKVLNLHNNSIDSSAADEISSMITNKNKLIELDISQNNLKSEGITKIAKALQLLNTLKVLNVGTNEITPEASIHMALVLKNNPSLESLNVSQNKLQTSGCINLCRALRNHHLSLKFFDISHNEIKPEAAQEIGHTLKGKRALEVLNISMNKFETKMNTIIVSLKSCKRLKKLILNNSGMINQLAVKNIYQVIHNNPMLEVLNISQTNLPTPGAITIFKALTNNRTLQILDVSHNKIDDTAIDQLVYSLQNNQVLRELKIQCNPLSSKASQHIVYTTCGSLKGLINIWVPHITDNETRVAIDDQIGRINRGRKANNQLKWFSDW